MDDAVIFAIHVMPGDLPAKLRGQAETEARRRLDDAAAAATLAAERAGNWSVEVRPVLVRGGGYVEIIRQARACEVDLKEWRDEAGAKFRRLGSELDASGVRWEKVPRSGGPESVIVNEAVRRRADLVAVGTHGRSGLAHALLGNVGVGAPRSAVRRRRRTADPLHVRAAMTNRPGGRAAWAIRGAR